MEENYECEPRITEESTLKNCSNIEIRSIINKKLGEGSHGIIYPIIVKFGSKEVTLILKKISTSLNNKKDQNEFINAMYDEVEYSYDMGKAKVGPRVYDAFFYQKGNIINQYIIMEKFDTSVANWILLEDQYASKLTPSRCYFVSEEMLNVLYKQIFVLDTYCGDIKTDNFVVNFNPMTVRMIDFGIDWCSNSKLPKAYSKVKTISKYSAIEKKEIFYCMCTLQLFMNIINIHTPLHIIKMILKPFFKDDIFIKYVLEKATTPQLEFKRIARRSRKRTDNIDFRKVLKDMLDYGHDQAVLLRHYVRKNRNMKSNEEMVDYVFDTIKKMTRIFIKK